MKVKLGEICEYVKGKTLVSELTDRTYISTENMLPNKMGITLASSLPTSEQTQIYRIKDVLVSNIRPYFKKIWQAEWDGGCSADVLVFRAKEGVFQDYLYFVLSDDRFFEYSMATSKGTKMPRGDKTSIMQYEVELPTYEEQVKIAAVLSDVEAKIKLNNEINSNLEQQMLSMFQNKFSDLYSCNSSSFESIIEFSNGKKRPDETGEFPVYGGNGILAYTNKSNSENCVIIGRVGAYCGNVFLSTAPCWVSDNAIQAKSKISDCQLFTYYALKCANLPSRHIGTGQPLMTQGILNSIPFGIPDKDTIISFENHCLPLQQTIENNLLENNNLSMLRDTLLPKLISGEIDLSNIDI